MKTEKILWAGIIILAILNIVCLTIIAFPTGNRLNKRFDNRVVESLNLDQEQIREFNSLKQLHRSQVDRIDQRMQRAYKEYFSLLKAEKRNTSKEDSLETVLANLYRGKVTATYSHFTDLKSLCRPEQKKNMDKIVPYLMEVIAPPKKDGPPRRK